VNERCSDRTSTAVPRGVIWTDGKSNSTGCVSIRARRDLASRWLAIRIAAIPTMCLAEGHGALIRSILHGLELFRVRRDEA
jgi:hypothetical protein